MKTYRPKNKELTLFCFCQVLMGAAVIAATQINFKYDPNAQQEQQSAPVEKPPPEPSREDFLQQQLAQQLNLPSLDTSSAPRPVEPNVGETKMFAQTNREIPEWVTVLKHFKNLKCASFLFVAWFMGFGIGLIFTFLFWHLQVKQRMNISMHSPHVHLLPDSCFSGLRGFSYVVRRSISYKPHI